jgi:acetolactate synthase-1/2/3 large subunit
MPSTGHADAREPLAILKVLAGCLPPETIVATDVGQHQMWVAQAYPLSVPRTLLTSGGLGTMGFGLPAAIGAALAKPGAKIVCVTGDGSFLMNIQELATLHELDVDVTVLVWNNLHLGLVRQQQELFYGARYHGCHFESDPDFAAIARGFGVSGVDLGAARDPLGTLSALMRRRGPLLVNLPLAAEHKVLPMVAPGASNRDMICAAAEKVARASPLRESVARRAVGHPASE